MSSPVPTWLVVFFDHIDQCKNTLIFISEATTMKRAISSVLNWNAPDKKALEEVTRFLNLKPFTTQTYINAIHVSSVAAFEEFLRQLVTHAINLHCKEVTKFCDLSEKLQDRHMIASGKLLQLKSSPPHHIKVNFFDVCQRLGTCIPKETEFQLNQIAIANSIRDIVGLDNVFEVLRDCGVRINMDTLGRDSKIQSILKTKGTRETSNEMKNFLEDVVHKRNRIAHTGAASDISEEKLKNHLDALRAIAESLCQTVTNS